MSELGFDLESMLQGADPIIEADCEVWLPPVRKNSKPLTFKIGWKRPDADEAKQLRDEITNQGKELQTANEKINEYQGYLKRLEDGDKKEVDQVDYSAALDELNAGIEEIEVWFRSKIEERIRYIKKLPLKNGKKQDVEQDQISDVLPVLFKWGYYDGIANSLRTTLDKGQQLEEKRKN